MNKQKDVPSVWQDLGALAGLYKNVLTMITHRVRYGADWQDELMEQVLSQREVADRRELAHSARR